MRQVLLIAFSWLLVTSLLAAPSLRHSEDTIAPFRLAKWLQVDTFSSLPPGLRGQLSKLLGVAIAEKGAAWNSGDALEPRFLARRFVVGGVSGNLAAVIYEHGGIAPEKHLVCLSRDAKGVYTVLANLIVDPATTRDLRQALEPGKHHAADHF